MRALKIHFQGSNNVSIDWRGEVGGAHAVAQKVGVAVMTREGSDAFLPSRGTRVTKVLLGGGVFDLLGIQHTLNFGALKARRDIQNYESSSQPATSRVAAIKMSLLDVKDNVARVGITASTQAGQTTRSINEIS